MKKSISVLLLIMVLVMAMLSGCKKGGETNTSDETEAQTTAPTTTATQTSEVSGPLSILCWYTQEQYQPILDAFSAKYPNVEIDFQNVPTENSQYKQKLDLLASAGEMPDIFYQGPPIIEYAKMGVFSDVSNLEAVQRLPQNVRDAFTYDGKVCVYSPDAWIGGVYYNKDIYAKYGLNEPENWDEFVNNCQVLLDAGIKPLAVAANTTDYVYWLHDTEFLTNDSTFDQKINTGETTFEQGYLDAIKTFVSDLYDKGFITQDMVGMTDDQRMTEFSMGEAAMTISGPWAVKGIREKNPDINLGIFPFAGKNGDKYCVGALNVGLSISAKSKHKEAAEAFINFLGSDEGLKLYQQLTGNFLAVEGVDYTIDPVLESLRQYAVSGQFALPVVDWVYGSALVPMFEQGMQEVVLGVKTPEELVKELDQKQQELIASEQ